MNHITYEGLIANDDNSFYGQITIDKDTGIISRVVSGKERVADKIFGTSCIIFPGMGDIHIHAREDETGEQLHKEEYRTAGNAALNGGLVHVSAMPNTPNPITDDERFQWHRDRVREIKHPVRILNYVGIGKGTRPIGRPGEHTYKVFFGKSVGSLTFFDEHELEDTIRHYAGHHVSFHVEYEPIVLAHAHGKTHSDRRPVECVDEGLRLLLPLIEKYGINAKLCHWSTGGESFKMIEEHRNRSAREGLPYTTIEVSPLHLLFDRSMTDSDSSLWLKIQMNPAVQTPEHREALIRGLRSGFIDYMATDHAPHTEEEKHKAFARFQKEFPDLSNIEIAHRLREENPELFFETCCEDGTSGAPWLDTYANICTFLMRTHDFTAQDIARVTASNPGAFVNKYLKNQLPEEDFGKGFGRVEEGYMGSLTVLNTDNPVTITRKNLQTKCKWSPLEDRSFPGGLEAVIIRGEDMTGRFN